MINIPKPFEKIEVRKQVAIQVLAALAGVDSLDFAILKHSENRMEELLDQGTSGAMVESALSAAGAQNASDASIFYRPARGKPAHIIFLDDLSLTDSKKIATGLSHLIVETSFHPDEGPIYNGKPNPCHQVWLRTDRLLTEPERKEVQKAMVEIHGGDKGSVSGEHWGRMPAFRNRKPVHPHAPWVNLVQWDLEDGDLDVEATLSAGFEAAERAERAKNDLDSSLCTLAKAKRSSPINSNSAESHKQYKYVCRSLIAGVNEDDVFRNAFDYALARGKRKSEKSTEVWVRKLISSAKEDPEVAAALCVQSARFSQTKTREQLLKEF